LSDDLPKTSRPRAPFRLGELEVLPESNELRGRRGTQRLRPLLMEVLLRLAREPGAVVRRETLLQEVWPRRMVNDEVLSRAIAELRTALGDEAREARYIETLPKVGYRLVAPVGKLPGVAAARASAMPGPPPTGKTESASTTSFASSSPSPPLAPSAAGPPFTSAADDRPPRRRLLIAAAGIAILAAGAAALLLGGRAKGYDPSRLDASLAQARPLTADPGIEVAPRLSPDGRRRPVVAATAEGSRLVVQALDGGERVEIPAGAGAVVQSPVFFPDGQRIAFWRGRPSSCEIVELRLPDRAERRLADCALFPRPRFDVAPDGRHLVFSGRKHEQYPFGLWLLPLDDGAAPRELTAPEPGAGGDAFPRFSPDGRKVAFFRGGESHRRAWMLDLADPARAAPLSRHEGLVYGLAWLGREGPLLVAADWLGFRALNVLDPSSGSARLAGARGARFPDVGPGGEVVYENATYSANLWRLEPGDSTAPPRALWPSTRYTSQAEVSPDGRQVVFTSNREGMDAIYVAPLDGEPRRIVGAENERYTRPRWSSDGATVLAVRTTQDGNGRATQQAVRVAAGGGPVQVLAELGTAVTDVRETRDGRHLVWGEASGHAMRLLRAPAASPGRSERLPLPLVSHFNLNATHLVYAQPQLPGLTRCRLADFSCAPMELALPETDLFHWSLTDRSIYRRVRESGAPRIERRALSDLRATGRWEAQAGGAGASIAASADDTILVFTREEGPAIDLMLARP
jgi:DNA-binding winged helix-turn-helix (wHTH) protein/Tol biopolymer transport system component